MTFSLYMVTSWIVIWTIKGSLAGVGISFRKVPRSIVAPLGDKVVFECETNLVADRLEWLHDWRFIPDLDTGKLTIKMARNIDDSREQTGMYQCVAWFGAESITSTPASLEIAMLSPFQEREDVREIVDVGHTAVLRCILPYSNPKAHVLFKKDGRDVHDIPGKMRVFSTGNLHIYNVTPADSGSYTCQASNHITRQVQTRKYKSILDVRVAPSSPSPPTFLVKPVETYPATIGENVTMECVATGNPLPKVKWTKYAGVLPEGRYEVFSGGLTLYGLTAHDEGTYICEVDNGRSDKIAIAALELQKRPVIKLEPNQSIVEEGSSATFECHVLGDYSIKPSILWVSNGDRLLDTGNIHISNNNKKLTLESVEKKHAGIYQCFVDNGFAMTTAEARLQVLPKAVKSSPHDDDNSAGTKSKKRGKHKGRKGRGRKKAKGRKKGKRGKYHHHHEEEGKSKKRFKLIPPSQPNVTRISEDSVMLNWEWHHGNGLDVLFFKIQFKELNNLKDWSTQEDEIPGHIRSASVNGLKTGSTYKFRIAAVYSNKDNKIGPKSNAFLLQRKPATNKITAQPYIGKHNAVSPSAIEIHWIFNNVENVPVAGFYIYYRSTTNVGDYSKKTSYGEGTRSDIITHLLPGTTYDIKIQAFDIGGTSGFSNIITEKTFSVTPLSTSTRPPVRPTRSPSGPTDSQLYIILGCVLAFILLVVFVCCIVYRTRSKTTTTDIGVSGEWDMEEKTYTYDRQGRTPVNGYFRNGYAGAVPDINRNQEERMAETAFTEDAVQGLEKTSSWKRAKKRVESCEVANTS